MNILVTGGAGYIGSHAVLKLIDAGHKVVVVDNLSNGNREAVHHLATFYRIDIHKTDHLVAILCCHNVEAVMHFAASISVEESVHDPLCYYHNNVTGTVSLLQAMKRSFVNRLVFSSSAAVYGHGSQVFLLDEYVNTQPLNPYGHSKRVVEQILQDMVEANPAFGFIAFRYFNVAGRSSYLPIVEPVNPPTNLISSALAVASGKREKITVFGSKYPTPDGTAIRDYIHVDDIAAAHVHSLDRLTVGTSEIYNLGMGRGYSVLEVIGAVEKVTDKEIRVEYGKERKGDIAHIRADTSKACRELNWCPQYRDIESIIASTWRG